MPTDKKITDLPVATTISATDVSVLVDAGTDYQYNFTLLLQFLKSNLSIGANISFGAALPQNTTGKNGDVFVNTATGAFAQKIAGTWTIVYTLPAANAADGTLLYGAGLPGTVTGKNADSYINTLTGVFYQKTGGSWMQVFSMSTGPQGPQGQAGNNGTDGKNGNTVLFGNADPSNISTGNDGDFYLNTATYLFFGPKTGGTWPSGVSIIGPEGPTGVQGATGPQGTTGATGAQGPAGPQGAEGQPGATGAQGATGTPGAVGAGVASGGSAGQVLAKVDNTDYNTHWVTAASGGGTPGGADKQLQYNSAGSFTGSSKLTFDGNVLNVNNGSFYLGVATAAPSAALQVDSTTQGVLIPRMTVAQRLAIASPAIGLRVYQTDTGTYGEGGYEYRSTGWSSSAGGVAGTNGQIQFNSNGSFAGSPRFTLDPSTYQLYLKGENYASLVIDAQNESGIELRNNGSRYAIFADANGTQSKWKEGSINDLGIYATNLYLNGNTYTTNGIYGDTLNIGNPTTYLKVFDFVGDGNQCLYTTFVYGSNSVNMANAKALYVNPQNNNDYLITASSGVNIGIASNATNTQADVFAQFMTESHSFILNGGGVFNDIPCAIFQITSTNKGALLPRMSTSQKNAIENPIPGLEVYDTTINKKCVFTGSIWETITSN